MKFTLTLFLSLGIVLTFAQTPSRFIHVDQFGYLLQAEKVAVLSNPQSGFNSSDNYNPANNLQVIDNSNQSIVFEAPAQIWNNGNTHEQSGDQGWWFDFSTLNTPGEYYILDNVSNERSAVFTISDNPYLEVMKQAARMFFYNRCNFDKATPFADPRWADADNFNNALQDFNCRYIYDPNNAALEKDLSGGWFDAGDYNKYVSFTRTTLHDLLFAYDSNPTAFGDNWNIPESGNAIPDIIDEIVWELEWLEKMQNEDGSVHNKMGSQNHSENSSSPPSVNTDQRFYGPTCSSASVSLASIFAHASLVLAQIEGLEGYAATLRQKAVLSYDYTLDLYNANNLETDCDDGSIVAGDADLDEDIQINLLLNAAIYLYAGTNDASYNDFINQHYNAATVFQINYLGLYDVYMADAFLMYAGLPGANPGVKDAMMNLINNLVNGNTEGLYGFNENDLYRSFMPDYSYHWGSNQAKASLGNLNAIYAQQDIQGGAENYNRKASEQVHYFHGINPLGLVYLTNMYDYGGDRCVNEMYHAWFNDGTIYDHALDSPNGPAPGYVVGGPNHYYGNGDYSPPYGQPRQKSFLDFNTGWPASSWEITEPAIYYQAAYIRLLAPFVKAEAIISSTQEQENASETFIVYPNPTQDRLYINEKLGQENLTIKIFNAQGQAVYQNDSPQSISVSHLPPGPYIIQLFNPSTKTTKHQKFQKI